MKDAWCLVVSDPEARAAEVINLYGKRWGIETTFRDIKDHKFGLGMAHVHTTSPARRDRLFLLSALLGDDHTLRGQEPRGEVTLAALALGVVNQQGLMRWFVLRLFADRPFSPDHPAKPIIVIRPETFIVSRHSFVACGQ